MADTKVVKSKAGDFVVTKEQADQLLALINIPKKVVCQDVTVRMVNATEYVVESLEVDKARSQVVINEKEIADQLKDWE